LSDVFLFLGCFRTGKKGRAFPRGHHTQSCSAANIWDAVESVPTGQKAVERRNFFRLFPPFAPFSAFGGCFLFLILDLRLLSEMRRQATQSDAQMTQSDAQMTQSDAQMTQSDAQMTQPFLQINGLRGLLRLSSLAFVFAAKRSECGGRRINQSLVTSSPTHELNGALPPSPGLWRPSGRLRVGRFHAGTGRRKERGIN
jgi:hypothetical protein